MPDVHAIVQQLARIEEGPPVVTLYLDTGWRDEQQRERVRLFFREQARDARARYDVGDDRRAGLDRTLERLALEVDDLVNGASYNGADGLVLVCSEPRGLFGAIALSQPITPALHVDTRPRIAPLVEHFAALHPALIIDVDHSGARILELSEGEVTFAHEIERDVPSRHKQGGWGQKKLQAWMRQRIDGVWKECAALLDRLAREGNHPYIVMFGTSENLQGFRRTLAPATSALVIGMLPPASDERSMLTAARASISEERIAKEFEQMRHVVTQGLSDRNGTVGLQESVMAMNERRVRMLVLSEGFDGTSYVCANCDGLWMSGATGCVFCGGATNMVGLREELVRRAARENVSLLVVPRGNRLDDFHGIGALLRHLSGEEVANIGYGAATDPTLLR